jgi:hypothetical protein
MREKLTEYGIMNLIPVGSAVTKTVRLGCNMIDVILNFNKPTLIKNENFSDARYEKIF